MPACRDWHREAFAARLVVTFAREMILRPQRRAGSFRARPATTADVAERESRTDAVVLSPDEVLQVVA